MSERVVDGGNPAGAPEAMTSYWLAAMIRNWIESDEVLAVNKAITVQPPGDPLTVIVFQVGGDHLMVQVLKAEVIVGG